MRAKAQWLQNLCDKTRRAQVSSNLFYQFTVRTRLLVCLHYSKELCFPVCEQLSFASIQAEVSEESHRFYQSIKTPTQGSHVYQDSCCGDLSVKSLVYNSSSNLENNHNKHFLIMHGTRLKLIKQYQNPKAAYEPTKIYTQYSHHKHARI